MVEKLQCTICFKNYVSDLNKLRDAFHNELTATAEELSKAMAFFTLVAVDAALASFMEKATARGEEPRSGGGGEAQSISWSSPANAPIFQTPTMDGSRVRQQIWIS